MRTHIFLSRWRAPLIPAVALAILLGLLPLATRAANSSTPPGLDRQPAIDLAELERMTTQPTIDGDSLQEVILPLGAERKRQSQLRQTLTPVAVPEALLRIQALEGFLDYDEEDQIIYGPGRTRINYGKFFLEADKVILDSRLKEAQAEGNVVLKIEADTIYADSMRYNFAEGEGVAYNVSGVHGPLYFRSASKPGEKELGDPQFEKISQQEALFRNTNVTTCDFKIPHYYLKSKEVILFQNDRVFLRGATLYITGVPVFYMPFFSRSLSESSPWFTQLGYGSRSGFRIREGYAYKHSTREPSFEDDKDYLTRSEGKAEVFMDYLSKLGAGGGVNYQYEFEFKKHRGQFELYGLHDSNREVVGDVAPKSETSTDDGEIFNESDRWRLKWLHRTKITDDLALVINVDEFSDPDIFYDALDFFQNDWDARERQIQRRSRVALTYQKEAYVVRLMTELKDRIGINRFNNFSDPRDDNFDFDFDPGRKIEDDDDLDGISNNRWGTVSSKLPHLTFATRHLPAGRNPLYYSTQLDIYNSLDKGLNIVDDDDDAYVQGIEFYQSLLYQWKISPRQVLLAKLGVGLGYANRNPDLDIDYPEPDFPQNLGSLRRGDNLGLTFTDDDGTFLVGTRKRNLDQIKAFYAWMDAELKYQARISDALTGDLSWQFRETTSDFIGDFYASLGNKTFREDLYDYKIRKNWINGELRYRLARPLLTLYTNGGWNLVGRSDVYSKERLGNWNTGFQWSNQRQTLIASGSAGWYRQQIYDPTDPAEYAEDVLRAGLNLVYSPIHQRWYTSVRGSYSNSLNGEAERGSDRELTYFTEEDTDSDIRFTYGRQLGPKWDTEFMVHWDDEVGGLREVSLMLQRDLHDAIGTFKVSLKNDNDDADARDDQEANELDMRFGLQLKMPDKKVALGAGNVVTLRQRYREPAVAN